MFSHHADEPERPTVADLNGEERFQSHPLAEPLSYRRADSFEQSTLSNASVQRRRARPSQAPPAMNRPLDALVSQQLQRLRLPRYTQKLL